MLKLECDDGCKTPYIYQKTSNCTLTKGEFYDMQIIPQ